MFDPLDFEPALMFAWPLPKGVAGEGAGLFAEAERLVLETKAQASPAEELLRLMAEMGDELRAQFESFRRIRQAAERTLEADQDEAAVKLAKADIKAANDALNQIIRTIEKIDTLQRSLVRERQAEAEGHFQPQTLAELIDGIHQKIEARAAERFDAMVRSRDAGTLALAETGPPGDDRRRAGQAAAGEG